MNGNSPEERLRFFKAILGLRPSPEPPVSGETRDLDPAYLPVGSVGPGVVVEAPFHCDYGYNITIGSNVIIGPDCRITDTCAVTIGNNVVFSPGVKLVCATYGIDPRERRKGKGRALGRNIIIEDDSWIGSNVTILPGVRVGRSSTVGAGSLICKVNYMPGLAYKRYSPLILSTGCTTLHSSGRKSSESCKRHLRRELSPCTSAPWSIIMVHVADLETFLHIRRRGVTGFAA